MGFLLVAAVLGSYLASFSTAAAAVVGIDARNGSFARRLAAGADFEIFRNSISSAGHSVVPLSDFSSGSLAGIDALFLLQPNSSESTFSSGEITAMVSFIGSGGGLTLLAEGGGGSSNEWSNAVAVEFGVFFADSATEGSGHVVTEFNPHPVTAGLGEVGIDFQRRISVSGDAVDLTVGTGADDILAVNGKVVMVSDSGLFADADSGADYPIDFGDNLRLLENIISYTVPEPSAMTLIVLSCTGFLLFRRR